MEYYNNIEITQNHLKDNLKNIKKTEKEFLKKLLEKYEDECIEETATYFHTSLDSLFDDIKKRIKELD